MQKQAIVTVRLVIDDDTTLDDTEQIVMESLENSDLMAYVTAERLEEVE